jgi:hypothetical protein
MYRRRAADSYGYAHLRSRVHLVDRVGNKLVSCYKREALAFCGAIGAYAWPPYRTPSHMWRCYRIHHQYERRGTERDYEEIIGQVPDDWIRDSLYIVRDTRILAVPDPHSYVEVDYTMAVSPPAWTEHELRSYRCVMRE